MELSPPGSYGSVEAESISIVVACMLLMVGGEVGGSVEFSIDGDGGQS